MADHKPKRFIPQSEVERRVNRSRWWIRKEVHAGRFPKPVNRDGGRVNDFVEDEIDGYIDSLIAKRDGIPAPDKREREHA